MNENDIERLIREESQRVEIKTTAASILERYRIEEKVNKTSKKPWYRRPSFMVGAPAFGIVAVLSIGLGTYFGLGAGGGGQPSVGSSGGGQVVIPLGDTRIQAASYEVLAGMSFIGSTGSDTQAAAVRRARQVSETQFEQICAAFDSHYGMIATLESYSASGFVYTPIASDDPTMPYCIQIADFKLYYDAPLQDEDEMLIQGYTTTLDGQRLQTVRIESEQEYEPGESESEIEVTLISADGTSVTIAQANESEGSESEDEFSLIQRDARGRELTEISFQLESEHGQTEKTFDIEVSEGRELEWSYTIFDETSTSMKLAFEGEDVEISYRDPILVELDPRVYTYGELEYRP